MPRRERKGPPTPTAVRINTVATYFDIAGADIADLLELTPSTFKRRMKEGFTEAQLDFLANECGVPREFLQHGWVDAHWPAEKAATGAQKRDARLAALKAGKEPKRPDPLPQDPQVRRAPKKK